MFLRLNCWISVCELSSHHDPMGLVYQAAILVTQSHQASLEPRWLPCQSLCSAIETTNLPVSLYQEAGAKLEVN